MTLSEVYGHPVSRTSKISRITVIEKAIFKAVGRRTDVFLERRNYLYAWFHDVSGTQFVLTFPPDIIFVLQELSCPE